MNTTETIQERIEELVMIADDFLKLCQVLNKFYDKHKAQLLRDTSIVGSSQLSSLIIHQKLYFSEAVLILKTLFESPKSPQEISYARLFKTISKQTIYYKDFRKLLKLYKETHLGKLRDRIIAHKDFKNAGDPVTHYLNPFSRQNLEDCRTIINELNILNEEHSNGISNNYCGIYSGGKGTVEGIIEALNELL